MRALVALTLLGCAAAQFSPGTLATVSTLAGGSQGSANGQGAAASFFNPTGVAVSSSGTVFVADHVNNMIRAVTPSGLVSTLAGSTTAGSTNGQGAAASF